MESPGKAASLDRSCYLVAGILGLYAFFLRLAYHNVADGDLWARLAAGAAVWHSGGVMRHDPFAFTPTLPLWIDHEWGAGVVFFALLRWFGPAGLLWFKIFAGLTATALALALGRRRGGGPAALLLLAIPCAWSILPGYVPVVRSHALSYLFFAATLLCLQLAYEGRRWPAYAVPPLMLLWANVHGGFVAGLGLIGVYTLSALALRKRRRVFLWTAAASGAAVLVNPYGAGFWSYLVPALLHPRPQIPEWAPLPLWAWDGFLGFRLCFLAVVVVLAAGWRVAERRHALPGLLMLAITAWLAWRHRRHAPFFGITAAAVTAPFLEALLHDVAARVRFSRQSAVSMAAVTIVLLYGAVAAYTVQVLLKDVSGRVLVPADFYPVRAADLLDRAQVAGNLAVPFRWGSYALWRLYPKIKVSIDGRYEETYPEETFQMNQDFFGKLGPRWARLVQDHRVDFVLLEPDRSNLRSEDLTTLGFALVSRDRRSELWVRPEHLARLQEVAARAPDQPIDPLDPRITARWWPSGG